MSFRNLHQPGNPFILANAWDAESAKVMAALGAKAIASTSAGHAFTLGKPDMGHVSREEALSHAEDLINATPLPVSGDLENGYGHDSESVAATIKEAAKRGLAGSCIEDTSLPSEEPCEFSLAVERIEAGAEAARALDEDFVLAARADGWMNGQYDFAEAMRRAKAFEKAGADVIYVPLLTFLGTQCVTHQHSDRYRPHASRQRSYPARHIKYGIRINITHNFRVTFIVCDLIYSNIDYSCTRLHHIRF